MSIEMQALQYQVGVSSEGRNVSAFAIRHCRYIQHTNRHKYMVSTGYKPHSK